MTGRVSNQTGQQRGEGPAMGRGAVALRLIVFLVVLLALALLLAGRWDWWGGWLWVLAYAVVMLGSLPFYTIEAELAEERATLKEDVKNWDKAMTTVLSLFVPFGFPILAALDVRFGWTQVTFPLWLMLGAALIFMAGTAFSVWAAAVNRFYTRYVRIQTDRGHHVISDGPYGVVRHPCYAGILLTLLVMPAVLGSTWLWIATAICGAVLVVRTVLEDRTLQAELPGYVDYMRRVRYQLLPGIW